MEEEIGEGGNAINGGDDVRYWREWAKMVDTVWTFIQVTYDCPGLNNNNMVPILDLNVRMEW